MAKPFWKTSRGQLREALWANYQGRYDDAWKILMLVTAKEVPKYANQTATPSHERGSRGQEQGVAGD